MTNVDVNAIQTVSLALTSLQLPTGEKLETECFCWRPQLKNRCRNSVLQEYRQGLCPIAKTIDRPICGRRQFGWGGWADMLFAYSFMFTSFSTVRPWIFRRKTIPSHPIMLTTN